MGWVAKSRRWWPCMGLAAADSIVVLYTPPSTGTTVGETNVWLEVLFRVQRSIDKVGMICGFKSIHFSHFSVQIAAVGVPACAG